MSLPPPRTPPVGRTLRLKVATAFRRARRGGRSKRHAFDAAMDVYLAERPMEKVDVQTASARVAEMLAPVVSVDRTWFWKYW